MKKILLAEDDLRLATLVRDFLMSNSFDVLCEQNGSLVADRVLHFKPDVLILDIMLPGKDGINICKDIRQSFDGAILILTARNENADQILGLEYGADDYVIKPVEPRILLARIRALLRRYRKQDTITDTNLDFGKLNIDYSKRDAIYDGQLANLSGHEFDLLSTLANHAGEVMDREILYKLLYNRDYDGLDRTIDVRVSQLRKKLGDNIDNPVRIKTIWGKGYLFVPDAW